jgi:hypothetical protein
MADNRVRCRTLPDFSGLFRTLFSSTGNIVESGIKNHRPHPNHLFFVCLCSSVISICFHNVYLHHCNHAYMAASSYYKILVKNQHLLSWRCTITPPMRLTLSKTCSKRQVLKMLCHDLTLCFNSLLFHF